MLCGPNGRAAAELLPGVDEILEFRAPWIDPDGHAVDGAAIDALVDDGCEPDASNRPLS